ncbi:hypothetical protein BRAO375_1060010 [Bradyrhizobium sp. ORS 375]|nr:hypothetical protein BRAO375_1060010 [Bradyrhizobium sp. ORS 375]
MLPRSGRCSRRRSSCRSAPIQARAYSGWRDDRILCRCRSRWKQCVHEQSVDAVVRRLFRTARRANRSILPTLSVAPVQSSRGKYSSFAFSEYMYVARILSHAEGRTRRHDTQGRGVVAAGLSGASAQDDWQLADGQAVWSWRPEAGAKLATTFVRRC